MSAGAALPQVAGAQPPNPGIMTPTEFMEYQKKKDAADHMASVLSSGVLKAIGNSMRLDGRTLRVEGKEVFKTAGVFPQDVTDTDFTCSMMASKIKSALENCSWIASVSVTVRQEERARLVISEVTLELPHDLYHRAN